MLRFMLKDAAVLYIARGKNVADGALRLLWEHASAVWLHVAAGDLLVEFFGRKLVGDYTNMVHAAGVPRDMWVLAVTPGHLAKDAKVRACKNAARSKRWCQESMVIRRGLLPLPPNIVVGDGGIIVSHGSDEQLHRVDGVGFSASITRKMEAYREKVKYALLGFDGDKMGGPRLVRRPDLSVLW